MEFLLNKWCETESYMKDSQPLLQSTPQYTKYNGKIACIWEEGIKLILWGNQRGWREGRGSQMKRIKGWKQNPKETKEKV